MPVRKVLVTGASKGIGRAIALRLLREGCRVVGLGRDFSRWTEHNPEFIAVTQDLGKLDELPQVMQALARAHTDIDALICNAGAGRFGSLEEFSYDQIRTLIDLNFTSHAYVVRALLPQMKRHRRGDIVFIGSEAALSGGRKGAVYSAAKFALRGFAQSLRQECASSGVRVGIIHPGMVRSEFFTELNFEPGADAAEAILVDDVAAAVWMMLTCRRGTVLDEISLSPLKRVIRSKK